ncbi:MAG: HAMP domain-containing protein [Chloroflexi bacterium]|nr:HAMP domain-containing protein [Chloroflexota bacterium]MBI3339308.1 HAMP domain-containing protein [Chloroflexota bacterium]
MTETMKYENHALFVSLRTKLIIVLALLFLVAFSAIFIWLDRFVTDMAMNNLQTNLIATAKTAAAGIDGDAHTSLFQSGRIDDAAYTKIADFLRSVKKTNPQASGVYTYVQLPDKPDQVQLVVSAALPPGSQPDAVSQASIGECLVPSSERPALGQDYTDISPTMVNGLKQAGAETLLWTDRWGTWLSGYAPIYNSKGESVGAVGVDMCAKNVIDLQQNIRRNTFIALGITLLILIVVVGLVAAGFTRPVLELTRVADRIGGGDYELDFTKLYSTRVQDEVDKLATVFELMVNKVYTREQTLRARVQQLEILIDKSKLETQVQEIVDSDFFQDLRSKVQDMRSRFKDKPDDRK